MKWVKRMQRPVEEITIDVETIVEPAWAEVARRERELADVRARSYELVP